MEENKNATRSWVTLFISVMSLAIAVAALILKLMR